jgi:hypothetical protein
VAVSSLFCEETVGAKLLQNRSNQLDLSPMSTLPNAANALRNILPQERMNHISNVIAGIISLLVVSAIFFSISAYNDFPASNQNMHALHASVLSKFTPGLSEDWLYNTIDPFPLATRITALFLKLGPGGVYVLYFLVIAAFILAFMIFLDSRTVRKDALASYLWSGLTVLVALVLGRVTGLSAGVADQLILGSYWQPSEAGIILVISVLLFASSWPVWSAVCAAFAVALHPSIAFGALILTTAACVRLMIEGQWRELFTFGGVFTLLVLPPVTYTIIQFMPTTSDLAESARHILAREKLPFHAIPAHWLATLDILKIFIIAIAAYIWRKQNERLSSILSISLILGVIATAVFAFLDHDYLLLLFPWRVSAILAPIALILIVSAVLNGLSHPWIYKQKLLLLFIPIMLLAGTVQFMKIYHDYPGFIPAYWIEATFRGGVYNMKVQDRLDRADVVNWAKRQDPTDLYLVPLDFEQFRIKSGRPIFVDWKSHPFKDTEVIEWKRRIEVAVKTFETLRECKKIDSNEFNVVIVDNSSILYKVEPNCKLYNEKQINSRFGFVKLR